MDCYITEKLALDCRNEALQCAGAPENLAVHAMTPIAARGHITFCMIGA